MRSSAVRLFLFPASGASFHVLFAWHCPRGGTVRTCLYCIVPSLFTPSWHNCRKAERVCAGGVFPKRRSKTRLLCNIKLRASQRWRCHDEHPCVCGFPSRSRRGHFCVGGRIPKACFYFWSWHDRCDDLMIARGWSNQRFSALEPDDPFCSPLVFRRVEAEHSLFLASFGDLR